ncbi:MAG: insulinase family protein [Rhodospirillales bacterium]|nr:insulinase family protein [Rhodospirillales bacterium]
MSRFYKNVRFLAALLIAGSILPAAAMAKLFDPETFTLSNGMQVVVISNHRAPVVQHMVWYKVGSADEAPGESGIAHLLEHLMFKGTDNQKPGEFSAAVARNGGQENAFTSYDHTAYYQTIAKDRLEMVMRMEADRMTHLLITPKQVAPERNVVLEERRMRVDNNPSSQLREEVNAALYLNYPYRRPVIGWEHEIKALNVDTILAFYKRHYAPNNALLIVEGDITVAELKPLAEKYYGVIPRGPDIVRERTIEPPAGADRRLELESERVTQPGWSRRYLAPSYHYGDTRQAYALQVLAEIIGGGPSSRLHKKLVVDDAIALSAGAFYDAEDIGPSVFGFYAAPKPGVEMAKLEAAVMHEVDGVLQTGVTDQEVAGAIDRMRNAAVLAKDDFGTAAQAFGAALTSGGTIDQVENWLQEIEKVTPASVAAAAKSVLQGTHSVTAELLPKPQS